MTTSLFDFAKTAQYSLKSLSPEQAKRIQSLLKACGYDVGAIDGIVGPKTTKAFASFKEDNYLEHPLLLGATTYDDLMDEANWRQGAGGQRPSTEVSPIEISTGKNKTVKVAGFGNLALTTRIAGSYTWGEATHDGTRPINIPEHAENIRRLATQLNAFQRTMEEPNKKFRITSWYRPEPWNSRAGGAPRSMHLSGRAIDIVLAGYTGLELAALARKFGWKGGIGTYKDKPSLLHLDIGSPRSWS